MLVNKTLIEQEIDLIVTNFEKKDVAIEYHKDNEDNKAVIKVTVGSEGKVVVFDI